MMSKVLLDVGGGEILVPTVFQAKGVWKAGAVFIP